MDYVKEISIKNFTCFSDVTISFSPGINVLIGKNGVGKTHLLKLIYANIHALKSYSNLSIEIQEKLLDSYFIEFISPLRRTNEQFEISVIYGDLTIESKSTEINEISATLSNAANYVRDVLYIPPAEVLTNFEVYSQFSEINKLNLDSTYHYIAQALSKNKVENCELQLLSDMVQGWLGAGIEKDEHGFYQKIGEKKIYASLLADGIKKLATLSFLIENNTLTSKSIVFIDEPEVHLNPVFISKYVELILKLAERGVQIFISSHDYLFTYLLSLHAEYKQEIRTTIKYFSLSSSNQGTMVESGETISDLQSNSIVEEYESLLDIEHSYFFRDSL